MSLEYVHEHPDPSSSDTPPSTPSDHDPHSRRTRGQSISQPPSTKRRARHGTDTGTDHETDSHHHRHHHRSGTGRLLARMMERDDHDSKKMSSLLLLTNERLDGETMRANEAERKASDLIKKFRDIILGRDLALQETARVREELSLYKAQLENAQREIYRAQDVIDRIAQEKHDAEEDAARARTKARKLQEEKMVMMAREEGRRQGFKEGLSRGRRIGFEEARSMAYDIADVDDGPEEEIGIRRTTSPENQTMQKNPVIAPRPVRATNGNPSRSNTYDTAPHAPTLPVPTVTTPVSPLSVTRAPRPQTTRTPVPVPVPAPSRSPESIHPRSIRNSMPSIAPHDARVIPRDGFIPTADRNSFINIPPPHELSVIVPSPQGSERSLPPSPSRTTDVFGPTMLTRDFAYAQGGGPGHDYGQGIPRQRTTSIASRGSTRISQYDLVSPPRGSQRAEGSSRYGTQSPRSMSNMLQAAVEGPRGEKYYHPENRSRTPGSNSKGQNEEYVSPTQRIVEDWRSANPPDMRAPSTPGYSNRATIQNDFQLPRVDGAPRRPREVPVQSRGAEVQSQTQQDMSRPRSPLDHFTHVNRSRSTPSVPEILIEPPSGTPSDASEATAAHPNFLSPDAAAREMPLPGDEELNEFVDANPNIPPPSNQHAPVVLPNNQLPFGFVPLTGPTTVMMASRSQTPRLGEQYAAAMLPAGLSYPDFYTRPSTSFQPIREPTNSSLNPRARQRVQSIGSASSPAPLQRPISLFSDDD